MRRRKVATQTPNENRSSRCGSLRCRCRAVRPRAWRLKCRPKCRCDGFGPWRPPSNARRLSMSTSPDARKDKPRCGKTGPRSIRTAQGRDRGGGLRFQRLLRPRLPCRRAILPYATGAEAKPLRGGRRKVMSPISQRFCWTPSQPLVGTTEPQRSKQMWSWRSTSLDSPKARASQRENLACDAQAWNRLRGPTTKSLPPRTTPRAQFPRCSGLEVALPGERHLPNTSSTTPSSPIPSRVSSRQFFSPCFPILSSPQTSYFRGGQAQPPVHSTPTFANFFFWTS